jgi:DNA-binding transcriptional LysR family regulator
MDINQIQYFLAIVETNGFTKAAEKLQISQPALSVSIRRLERELGVTLFERGGRRAILTPAGQLFLETARDMWTRYQSTLNELRNLRSQPTLRLGILRTFRIDDLVKMITLFRARHENVVIELRDGTAKDLYNWLTQGEVDLLITELTSLEDSETSLTLFQQRYLLAVPQHHPFAKREHVSLAELDDQLFIGRSNCDIWGKAPQMFEAAGVEPRVVYIADREEWAISMVRAGLGITIMPEWGDLTDIVYVAIAEANLCRTVGLKWRLQQNSQIIRLFQTFAANYSWPIAATGA